MDGLAISIQSNSWAKSCFLIRGTEAALEDCHLDEFGEGTKGGFGLQLERDLLRKE